MLQKFLHNIKQYKDIPVDKLKKLSFSVYIIDKNWNYLFVNDFVPLNLGLNENLEGKNMWQRFPALLADEAFIKLKLNSEAGISSKITLTSPLTSQRINIVSYILDDCFVFYSVILPR